jgi:hypothetical protein
MEIIILFSILAVVGFTGAIVTHLRDKKHTPAH